MLVLHPSSTCDVCLDPYNDEKTPHAITCGHSFCLRCLQLLTRHCCPLCRKYFTPDEVRRLHTGKESRCETPPPSDATSALSGEAMPRAQKLLRRITRIVREGALASEVRDVIEEVHAWLLTQPPEEHPDLRSAHLLLFRYTELQRKATEDKHAYADLQQNCHELKEQLRSQEEAAEARYQELDRLRNDELGAAKMMKESLQDRYERMEKDWSGKYEVCLAECRRLLEELRDLKRTHQNPLPHPPRSVEPRYYYLADRASSNPEPLLILKDDSLDSTSALKVKIAGKEEMFRLSPVPPTLPIPPLSNCFRPLTDDIDFHDDEESKGQESRSNPYTLRSIDPIPIKPSVQRMSSSNSLLSRYDDPMSRSLPRSSLDVHMASCSSSPSVSALHPAARERHSDGISGALGVAQEDALGLRIGPSRRPSSGSETGSRDQDEQRERWRAQLRDLLHDPSPSPSRMESRDLRQGHVDSHNSVISDCSPAPVIPPPPTTSPKTCMVRSNTISRASTAAMAAERARASSINNGSSPISPSTPGTKDRDMMAPPLQSPPYGPQVRPIYSRMGSVESLRTKTTSSTASGLTKSLWMQEQRV